MASQSAAAASGFEDAPEAVGLAPAVLLEPEVGVESSILTVGGVEDVVVRCTSATVAGFFVALGFVATPVFLGVMAVVAALPTLLVTCVRRCASVIGFCGVAGFGPAPGARPATGGFGGDPTAAQVPNPVSIANAVTNATARTRHFGSSSHARAILTRAGTGRRGSLGSFTLCRPSPTLDPPGIRRTRIPRFDHPRDRDITH